MNDDGDAVIGQDGGRQAAGCFLILQIAAAEANVTAALLDSLDAGAGTGGVVGKGHAVVLLHERLAQRPDHLLHRGGAVGRHRTGELLGTSGQHRRNHGNSHDQANQFLCFLFHDK